jgi:hypothetical protein
VVGKLFIIYSYFPLSSLKNIEIESDQPSIKSNTHTHTLTLLIVPIELTSDRLSGAHFFGEASHDEIGGYCYSCQAPHGPVETEVPHLQKLPHNVIMTFN